MLLTAPELLQTERLVLRRVRADDAEPLFHAFGGSVLATRYLTWSPAASVEEYRAFLTGVAVRDWENGSGLHWVIEEQASPPVGMVSLEPGAAGMELGYVLAPERWGRGLMTEAAAAAVQWARSASGGGRVWATCDCENQASVRVLEKLGFTRERILRGWAVHPNLGPGLRDAFRYGITDPAPCVSAARPCGSPRWPRRPGTRGSPA